MPLISFYSEPILYVIHFLNSCVCQKTAPANFEKNRLSLKLLCLSKSVFKVEKGSRCQNPAPPGLRLNFDI